MSTLLYFRNVTKPEKRGVIIRQGRPRYYADNAAKQKAYRQRQTQQRSASEALIQACGTPDPEGETWEAFIGRIGHTLHCAEQQRDALEWLTARLTVAADQAAGNHPAMRGRQPHQISRKLISDLRNLWARVGVAGPSPTVLNNALRVYASFPDLFADKRQSISLVKTTNP
jgi:hypothetical protein